MRASKVATPLAGQLRVFRRPALPQDWRVPSGLLLNAQLDLFGDGRLTVQPGRSRLVATLDRDRVRLYAAPTWIGLICYQIDPIVYGGSECGGSLLHGIDAHVQVAAGG
jgi:hypothetical protein